MSVDVKVIKKIDKRDYPKWLNEEPKRQAYEITINGKKTYAYWESPDNNMLYVDGYGSDLNPNIQGWDVINSLISSRDYEPLFGDNMYNVDKIIDKAIKHFELTKSLKDGAKEAWSDILEFKQIVLEALNDLDIEVIGVAKEGWGMKESGSIIYDVNINNVPTTVEFLPGGSGDEDWLNIRLINGKSWGNAGNLYKLLHLDDNLPLQELTLSIERAIKHYNLTKGLKKSAKEAWSNILESKSAPPIKVIKRLTGKEGLFHRLSPWIAEDVKKEGGWLVHDDDTRLLHFYDHGKLLRVGIDQPLSPFIANSSLEDEQAIKHWELTKGLKDGAKEAWSNILESKSAPPIKVIREANIHELACADDYFLRGGQSMLVKPIDKGWIVKCQGTEYFIFPNYVKHMQPYLDDQAYVMFTKQGRWINYSTDRVPTNILQNSELKKAINHYELTKGLKKGAKEDWSNILEFKQIVLESLNDLNIEVIGVSKEEWYMKNAGSTVYNVNINNVPILVEIIPSITGDNKINITSDKGKTWINYRQFYKILHLKYLSIPFLDIYLSIERAINHYELTKGLKKGAKEAWKDILS